MVLKDYYYDNVVFVKIGKALSDAIEVTKGLSPILFNIYLGKTIGHWKNCQGMGVPIEENKFLFSLNYADDQVIRAKDADDLESALKNWTMHIMNGV